MTQTAVTGYHHVWWRSFVHILQLLHIRCC